MLYQGGIILRGLNKRSRIVQLNVFFIELIIVLLFFSISVAVVLRLFAAADSKALKSESGERVMLSVQSISEMYSVAGDMKETVLKLFGEPYCNFGDNGKCTVYFDYMALPLVVYEADLKARAEDLIRFDITESFRNSDCGKFSELAINVIYLRNNGEEHFYDHKCSAYIPDFKGGASGET